MIEERISKNTMRKRERPYESEEEIEAKLGWVRHSYMKEVETRCEE